MFPTERAVALRELGLVHASLGRKRKALKLIDKSRVAAQRQTEKYELAQSSLSLAQLRMELGMSGAESEVRAAEEEMGRFTQMIESVQNDVEANVADQ